MVAALKDGKEISIHRSVSIKRVKKNCSMQILANIITKIMFVESATGSSAIMMNDHLILSHKVVVRIMLTVMIVINVTALHRFWLCVCVCGIVCIHQASPINTYLN